MSKLEQKSRQAHAGFYLTLVSIMQSLAFGYLLQVLGSELTTRGMLSLNISLQALTMLLILILVWHEYAIGTIAYAWKLDFFDSTIPFLFGITEYAMISFMAISDDKQFFGKTRYVCWLWSIAAFAFVGVLAYFNQHKKAEIDSDENPNTLKIPKKNMFVTIGYFAFFVVFAGVLSHFQIPDKYCWIPSLVLTIMFAIESFRANRAYADL
jgi:hypothetical protein